MPPTSPALEPSLDRVLLNEAAGDAGRGLRESPAIRAASAAVDRLLAAQSHPDLRQAKARTKAGCFLLAELFVVTAWAVVGQWMFALLFAGIGAVATGLFLTGKRREHNRRYYALSACTSCGYSLRGLADGIPPTLLGGRHTGPAACPECGTRWPRLPPG